MSGVTPREYGCSLSHMKAAEDHLRLAAHYLSGSFTEWQYVESKRVEVLAAIHRLKTSRKAAEAANPP